MLRPFEASFPIPDPQDKGSSSKKKGDTLELIVEELCSGYGNAKVRRDIKVPGRSGTERQIDVLIEATLKSFDIKIVVEAKNYSEKVGIEKVEAFSAKLFDVGGNVGVMVCPLGFTAGAINAAALADIQLFQAFDHQLGNTTQLIPLRYITTDLNQFQLRISSGAMGSTFKLPVDNSTWRFDVQGKLLDLSDLARHAWNNRMVPQEAGEHIADFGILKISVVGDPAHFYYIEVKVLIKVIANYYLKLFPASFMKNIASQKGNHQLRVDIYSKQEEMLENGWKHFETREEMEEEAVQHDTSPDVRGLVMRPESVYEEGNSKDE